MESINGVTFEEYASACGKLAQGEKEDLILEVLGLEKPVWDETLDKWNARFGELLATDMSLGTKYGEVFANPVAGRFAGAAKPSGVSLSDLLVQVPDYETYQKILWQQSVANKYGIDPVTVLESNGLSLGSWGALNIHYMNSGLNSISLNDPQYNEKHNYYLSLMNHWENYWEEYYSENKVNLSDDITF